jgi:uncharacterized protein (TIGR02246 family)
MTENQRTAAAASLGEDISAGDRGALEELIHAYAAGIDQKDADLFNSVFTEDVQFSLGEIVGPFDGLDELSSFMTHFHAPLDASQHRVSNMRIIAFDGAVATVRSAIDAVLVKSDHPEGNTFRITGFYEDEAVKADGRWRIRRRALEPVWSEGNPNVGDWNWSYDGARV